MCGPSDQTRRQKGVSVWRGGQGGAQEQFPRQPKAAPQCPPHSVSPTASAPSVSPLRPFPAPVLRPAPVSEYREGCSMGSHLSARGACRPRRCTAPAPAGSPSPGLSRCSPGARPAGPSLLFPPSRRSLSLWFRSVSVPLFPAAPG